MTVHQVFRSLLSSGSSFSFHLQVVNSSLQPEETSRILVISEGGEVPCPGLNSSTDTNVIWYKVKHTHKHDCTFHNGYIKTRDTFKQMCFLQGNKTMSEQKRQSCVMNGWLHLCQVHECDTGVYFCERQIIDEGVTRTLRRAVSVRAVRKC